jgi:hypothetical protein
MRAEGDGFCVGESNEQRAGKAGTGSSGDGLEIVEGDVRAAQSFADDRNYRAKVFAGSKFGDDAAIFAVNFELACDDRGQNFGFAGENSGCGFIAG